jgi:hypothetical protein
MLPDILFGLSDVGLGDAENLDAKPKKSSFYMSIRQRILL